MSITPSYSFQHSSDTLTETWIVSVNRENFKGYVNSWPKMITLGCVDLHNKITEAQFDVWTRRYYSNRNADYLAEARRLIQDGEMWKQLVQARTAFFAKEQTEGLVFLDIGGREYSRWHTFLRAVEYAEERLHTIWLRGLQIPRRAEISRQPGGVFHAVEVNDFGHAKVVPSDRLPNETQGLRG